MLVGTRRAALQFIVASMGAATIAGCAAPSVFDGQPAPAEVYVGLGRTKAVVVLEAATDQERRRVSLAPLGPRGLPWQIRAGPAGNAAVMPLTSSSPQIGVIAAPAGGEEPASTAGRGISRPVRSPARPAERCSLISVASGRPRSRSSGVIEAPQTLAADARGRGYVLLSDFAGDEPSYVAIVDLQRQRVLRHLPAAAAGESVLALASYPDGARVYTGVWAWDERGPGGRRSGSGGQSAPGRLVALDAVTGQARAQADLTPEAAVIDLALAGPPPGMRTGDDLALYALVAVPGPSREEDDWWQPQTQFTLVALDALRLDPLASWPLSRRPTALGIPADGTRAYLLAGGLGSGWSTVLSCLDLASGGVAARWQLPGGCFALTVSKVGKAYVADPFGDRLWRLDTNRQQLLPPLPLPGAPIALAAGAV